MLDQFKKAFDLFSDPAETEKQRKRRELEEMVEQQKKRLQIEMCRDDTLFGVHPESSEEQIAAAFKKLIAENPHLQKILELHEMTDDIENWSDGEFVTFLFAITPGPDREE